jgi:hypothetical protein
MVSSRLRECFQRCIYRVGFGVGYISLDVGSDIWPVLIYDFTVWESWRNGTASWRYVIIYYPVARGNWIQRKRYWQHL